MVQPAAQPSVVSDFEAHLTRQQRPLFRQLQHLLPQEQQTLVWRYRIGKAVADLQAAVAQHDRGWVKELAAVLGQSTSHLTKERQFARDFTLPAVEKLDQQGCTWGMITVVLHVPREASRDLLQEALTKKWNLAELKAEVRKRFGADHAGGRPLRAPATAELGLRQLATLSRKWLRYYTEIWGGGKNPVTEQLAQLPLQGNPQALQQTLSETQETLHQMEQAIAKVNRFLSTLGAKGRRQRR